MSKILKKFRKIKLKDEPISVPHEDVNIMLMGETGVGKSTFINAIANYFQFDDLDSAVDAENITLLIPTHFSMIDEEGEEHRLSCGEDKNETLETGKAGTQCVKTYVFPVGDTNFNLRLIDTPGMGDPRGIEKDEENCENILQFISGVQKLHAICFLMKPTNTRSTALFTYCVKQILSRLDKTASENIVFVFTNTRGTNYTPGDTMGVLKKMVNEIKASPPYVDIPLKNNIFSMDNEAFRILLSLQEGLELNENVIKCCKESWETSCKESWRLFTYITGNGPEQQGLQPHDVKNTISINEVRNLIDQLAKPLSEISQLIQDNIRALDKQKDNLNMENQTLEELKNKLFMPVVTLRVKELSQPVTVCTNKECADVVQVGDKTKWHYRQRCHNPCFLQGVPREVIGDSRLIKCAAMNGSRNCKECSCDYSLHMHIYYETETVDDKIEDSHVKQNIDTKEKALEKTQLLIEQMNERKAEFEEEHKIIIETTAKFAHFLQRNAITPFNDSYKEYIEHLIIRERGLGDSADLKMIEHLQKSLKKHEELKTAFDNNLKSTSSVKNSVITADSIKRDIDNLYKLKHNGKKIKELIDKQKTARSKEYNFTFESVSVKPVTMKRLKKSFKEQSLPLRNSNDQQLTENTPVSSDTAIVKPEDVSNEIKVQTNSQPCCGAPVTNYCQHCVRPHNQSSSQNPYCWPPPPPYYNYYMPPPHPSYFGMPPDPYRLFGAYYGGQNPFTAQFERQNSETNQSTPIQNSKDPMALESSSPSPNNFQMPPPYLMQSMNSSSNVDPYRLFGAYYGNQNAFAPQFMQQNRETNRSIPIQNTKDAIVSESPSPFPNDFQMPPPYYMQSMNGFNASHPESQKPFNQPPYPNVSAFRQNYFLSMNFPNGPPHSQPAVDEETGKPFIDAQEFPNEDVKEDFQKRQ